MVAQPKDQFSTLISFDLSQVLELIVQLQSLDLLYFQQSSGERIIELMYSGSFDISVVCFLQQELSCY